MKLFFPEISHCFGGTPAAETIAAEAPGRRQRRRRCMAQGGGSAKQWRPALAAIAEDGGCREARRQRAESAVGFGFRSEKKPLIKSKLAGKTRSDSYGSDYGESTHPIALPAFSAAPFLV